MVAITMQGRTPLHNAAFANDTEAVKILLRYGADATAVDSQVRPLALFAGVYEGATKVAFRTRLRHA